jgi:hypothetical protein
MCTPDVAAGEFELCSSQPFGNILYEVVPYRSSAEHIAVMMTTLSHWGVACCIHNGNSSSAQAIDYMKRIGLKHFSIEESAGDESEINTDIFVDENKVNFYIVPGSHEDVRAFVDDMGTLNHEHMIEVARDNGYTLIHVGKGVHLEDSSFCFASPRGPRRSGYLPGRRIAPRPLCQANGNMASDPQYAPLNTMPIGAFYDL